MTGSWLTYRTPTPDQTRSRWPLASEWEQVQRARIAEGAAGIDRVYDGQHAGSLRRLMPGLVGYLASFASLTGCTDIEDTAAALPATLRDYELASRTVFADRIADKVRAAAFS